MGRGPEAQGTLRQKRIAKKERRRAASPLLFGGGGGIPAVDKGTGSFTYQNRSVRVKGYKKRDTAKPCLFWQREKDSNPHIRSQSPLCYLYTIPLCSDEQKLLYRFRCVCQELFFTFRGKKPRRAPIGGERAEPCAEREVFYLPCACTRSAPVRYLPSGL